MDALLQKTRLVRFVVVLVAFLSYTFLLLKRMNLNKLLHVNVHEASLHETSRQLNFLPRGNEIHKLPVGDRRHLVCTKRPSSSASGGQPRGHTAQPSPFCKLSTRLVAESSRLPQWDGRFKCFATIVLGLLTFELVKFLASLALRYTSLEAQGYLDCFLVGRPSLNGRTTEFMSGFFVSGTIIMIAWPAIKLPHLGHVIRLDVFEFLLCDYRYLVAREVRRNSRYWLDAADGTIALGRRRSFYMEPLFELINRFQLNGKRSFATDVLTVPGCLQRPNRTPKAWMELSRRLLIIMSSALLVIILASMIVTYMAIPLIFSRNGFAMQHRLCLKWVLKRREIDANRSSDYSFLLELADEDELRARIASVERQPFIPWTDFCPPNWYHAPRMLYSTVIMYLFYYGITNLLVTNTTISCMVAADMVIYSRELNKRLRRLTIAQRAHLDRAQWHWLGSGHPICASVSLTAETNQVQALLIDHFELIAAYDGFASISATVTMIIWFGYSLLISTWIFLPGDFSSGNRLEWAILHLYGSVHAFATVGSFARARNMSRRLYPLITSAAALSNGAQLAQRRRWQTIMCYYGPKSLYCFRALHSTELSWLFLFKLTMWLFSALLVVSTFYSVYKTSN